MLEINYTKSAVKAINAMDRPTKGRIKAGIEKLPSGDIKKLRGYISAYRLRIGDYRVLFDLKDDIITITAVLPRGDAYKGL